MISATLHPGRIVLWALAGVVIAASSITALGLAEDEEKPVKETQAKPQEAEPNPTVAGSPGEHDAAPTTDIVLLITVTGDGQPIGGADVRLKFPASVGGEETRPTNAQGQVKFKSAATGDAIVLVFANHWASLKKDVVLKRGAQKLTLQLAPPPLDN